MASSSGPNWNTDHDGGPFDPGPCSGVGAFDKLPYFSIRNGDPLDARSLLMKPTIAPVYHWTPIPGLPPRAATNHVGVYIRLALARIKAHPPREMSDAMKKKAAICLGVARAVTTATYEIRENDLIPDEVATPVLIYKPDEGTNGGFVFQGDTPAAVKEAMSEELVLDDDERAAIATLHMCSLGLLPLQGYSLLMNNHHYLSEKSTQSRRAFAAVERQFWRGATVSTWFASDATHIQDILWHKATHPVSISRKHSAARSTDVAVMLREAGVGSAAARLPAQEPEIRAARSYKTLLQTVQPMIVSYGGEVNFTRLTEALDVVNVYPVASRTTRLIERSMLPPGVPAYVVDRFTAIQYLKDVMERNSDIVAFCYGFYCAFADQNETLAATGVVDSLRTSYSLTKLREQSYAAFVSGQQSFGDYTSARQQMRSRGEYDPPKLKHV